MVASCSVQPLPRAVGKWDLGKHPRVCKLGPGQGMGLCSQVDRTLTSAVQQREVMPMNRRTAPWGQSAGKRWPLPLPPSAAAASCCCWLPPPLLPKGRGAAGGVVGSGPAAG